MNTVLSINLKKFRQHKKFTQEQVAERLGVSTHTVSRWECNTTLPDVTMLPEIARLYDVTIDDLFKESSVAYENYAQRLASIYEATREPKDFILADAEFKKLIKSGTLTTTDMWAYGVIHQFMMNDCKDKAFAWFDRVLEQGVETDAFAYWRTRAQRMKLMAQIGKAGESIREQHTVIEHKPHDAKEWGMLLAAYMYANRYEEAYQWFLKAIALFTDEWELYIHGGDICKKLQRYDEAFSYWDKAGQIGTTFLDEKYAKAFCYEEMGNDAKAYDTWREIATELFKDGYDVETAAAEKRAQACMERIKQKHFCGTS